MKSLLKILKLIAILIVMFMAIVICIGSSLVRAVWLSALVIGVLVGIATSKFEARSQRSGGRAARAEHEEIATVLA